MAVAFAGAVDMVDLVRARARVDKETVAPERRTPPVPITGFSYDRNAMRNARLARSRMATPVATPERSGPVFVAVAGQRVRPVAATAVLAPKSGVAVVCHQTRPSRALGEPEQGFADEPVAVFTCIAEYPIVTQMGPGTKPTSILSGPTSAPDPGGIEAVDRVSARDQATAADAHLRAVALASRSAGIQGRLASYASGSSIDLTGDAGAVCAARAVARRCLERA